MAGAKEMVPGFNHNLKHRGTAYHIQTEDSGLGNPHVITHLFVGGNIIASKKTSYVDIVGAKNLPQLVRELMEEQHKDMLRNLVNGVYDEVDEAISAKARAYQPGELAPEPPRPAAPPVAAPTATAGRLVPPQLPHLRAAPSGSKQAPCGSAPPAAAPRLGQADPGPRPPAPTPAGAPMTAVSRPPALVPAGAPAPLTTGTPTTAASHRERSDTIFGEDLISEKSLDEVILSYLAEDLGEKP